MIEFKSGDKVRCIRKDWTPWEDNLVLIEIGEVYTIGHATEYGTPGDYVINLTEVTAAHPRGPNFYSADFEHVYDTTISTSVANDAWDRSMKGMI